MRIKILWFYRIMAVMLIIIGVMNMKIKQLNNFEYVRRTAPIFHDSLYNIIKIRQEKWAVVITTAPYFLSDPNRIVIRNKYIVWNGTGAFIRGGEKNEK